MINKWVDIFKSGTQTDNAGNVKTWTNAELEKMIAAFDNGVDTYRVPVVIGHPKTDSPAYGWVSALRRVGDVLQARFKDLNPQFVEGVKKKLWPNRSIRIAKEKDDTYKLVHVGFLGASAPAVEGLEPIYAATDGIFLDYDSKQNIKGESSVEEVQQTPQKDIDLSVSQEKTGQFSQKDLEQAVDLAIQKTRSEFSQKEQELSETVSLAVEKARSDYSQREQDLQLQITRLANDLESEKKKSAHAAFNAWVDDMIGKGQLLPAQSVGVVEFMATLHSKEEIQFSADSESKVNPLTFFKQFVEKLPQQVEVSREYAKMPRTEEKSHNDGAKVLAYMQKQYKAGGNA